MDNTFVWWFKWGMAVMVLITAPLSFFVYAARKADMSNDATAFIPVLIVVVVCFAGIIGCIAVGVKRLRS